MDVPAIMAQTRVKITKTIESFENKAYKVVSGLIADKGYAELSMKMIAKEMDVAVGTLYNYYKNKEDLTTSVIYISWVETFRKLDDILEGPKSSKEKASIFLSLLYDEMEERRGLDNEMLNSSFFKNEKLIQVQTEFRKRWEKLILEWGENKGINFSEDYTNRVINTMVSTITNSLNEFEEEKEANKIFIEDLLHKLL